MADDPFDNVLNLEEQFFAEGYKQGMEDGTRAGKIEGRGLGLERGFEKFVQSGRLYGKAVVWANRLPRKQALAPPAADASLPSLAASPEIRVGAAQETRTESQRLPCLPSSSKLQKNITSLHALMEPDTLSTENTDEAVNDFDDRLKKAQGRARIVEMMIGGDGSRDTAVARDTRDGEEAATESQAPPTAVRTDW